MTSKSDKQVRLKQWTPEPKTLLDRTSAAARAIIEDEARHRADKTERLRAARLQREGAEEPPARAVGKKKRE